MSDEQKKNTNQHNNDQHNQTNQHDNDQSDQHRQSRQSRQTRQPDDPRGSADIGGFVQGLGDMVEAMQAAMHEVQERLQQSGVHVEQSGDPDKGSYHFSVQTNIGNIPRSGNIPRGTSSPSGAASAFHRNRRSHPAGKPAPPAPDVREPLVDVFDEETDVVIVVELPGVSMDDIRVHLNETTLTLQTTGERVYASEITLPAAVDTTTLQQTYRNGILELRLHKL